MGKPLKALIVEDSQDDADLLARELERGGFDVRFERVQTAEGLNAALDKGGWDILFGDYTMPRFRGTEALEIVRRRSPDLPFIFVSGTMGEGAAVEAMKAGADDFVVKGNLMRLVPAVERELRDADTRRGRRKAEEALRASEERHRVLFEHIADVILVFDGQGRIQLASASLEQVLGSPGDDVIGRSSLSLVHPEDVPLAREAFARVTGERGAVEVVEVRMVHRDGSVRIMECVLRNLLDHPDVRGIVVTSRNITERKQLEAEVLQTQKLESVGRLAGGIAHDFNNLLTAVRGYADLLVTDPGLPDPLIADVEGIREAVDRASALTRQLLAFGRKQVLDLRPLDLNEITEKVTGMLGRLLGEDIEIETDLAPELGTVHGDVSQMEQVLVNLAVNARDAMPHGGRLTIRTRNVDVTNPPSGRRSHAEPEDGRYVVLAMSDSGVGMDPETLDRLFEPFFTTKDPGEGTGLGLATVYGIVRQSGGHVHAESSPGEGATFEVYLPRVDGVPERIGSDLATGPPPRGTETILVVEDEASIRDLVRRILEALGYSVLEAAARDEAVRVLSEDRDRRIDMMLSDVVLPGMGGKALGDEVAALRPDLPVLYMSGYPNSVLTGRGILGSDVELIQKPFTRSSLARRIRAFLDARRGQRPESEIR